MLEELEQAPARREGCTPEASCRLPGGADGPRACAMGVGWVHGEQRRSLLLARRVQVTGISVGGVGDSAGDAERPRSVAAPAARKRPKFL